jgi:mRNA-degrading endonuclease toxin of MazEF toxin-antitoxin module
MSRLPDRGDIIHCNFSPAAGTEMREPHYALVLSPAIFSKATGKAMVCPITSKGRCSNFEVVMPAGILPRKAGTFHQADSYILADQARTIDYMIRKAEFVARAPKDIIDEVTEIVLVIVDPAALG